MAVRHPKTVPRLANKAHLMQDIMILFNRHSGRRAMFFFRIPQASGRAPTGSATLVARLRIWEVALVAVSMLELATVTIAAMTRPIGCKPQSVKALFCKSFMGLKDIVFHLGQLSGEFFYNG